ncbi:MAG TPA: DUF3857 domain-containing protein [Verrucomicrobiae bacterium]|nr:DUF3857 domain-containing protein [Verrucomicrobiae bacterium]
MLNEARPDTSDPIAPARNRIQTGPVPEWVTECPYDSEFKSGSDNHLTYLLFDRQVHAERRETFVHVAFRLETMEAVQHQSQWRLQYEPRTHSHTLHFLKIRRNGVEIDHLDLKKAHFLQREEGLDRQVIQGWFTLMLVLEDVRPGDILEWAYTLKEDLQILPEFCESFFNLPEWVSIGKYHFTARFNPARAVKWKSSAAELKPLESTEDGWTVWKWTAEKYVGMKREPNTPAWYVSAPWIQISDCPDWQTVARAVWQMWAKQKSDTPLDELINEIEKAGPGLSARIGKAIELIQDDYRYLSVNLEFGGQIPTPPEVVARRRYGDCKDLSFLLVNVLKQLGVTSRPILVHTGLRKSVGDVLPTPGVFNHVIVEFEAEGKRRWIDATMKRQGGGAFNRVIHDFGLGLPVDADATGLVEPPQIPEQSHLYELHEIILVDTTGGPSLVSMVIRAEGSQAEIFRHQFETMGMEEMAKQGLQNCANRFGQATRIGSLQRRDDKSSNQFFLAETFEINGFIHALPDGQRCQFRIPSYWINQSLVMPEKKERRTPFALPYPYQVVHIMEVQSPLLQHTSGRQIQPRFFRDNPFVQFNRKSKAGSQYCMMTLSLTASADSVSADQLEKHRAFVEEIWKESAWHMILSLGYSRIKPGRNFGMLPAPVSTTPLANQSQITVINTPASPGINQVAPSIQAGVNDRSKSTPQALTQSARSPQKRRRQSHQHRPSERRGVPLWVKIAMIVFALALFILILILVGKLKP